MSRSITSQFCFYKARFWIFWNLNNEGPKGWKTKLDYHDSIRIAFSTAMKTSASLKVRVQPNAHNLSFLSLPCEMLNLLLIAAVVLLFPIVVKLLWWKESKSYRLPPGPKRNAVFGNLMELIHSSIILKEAPFLKFAKWAFQVKKS